MSKKDGKQLTNDELLAQFDDLNVDVASHPPPSGSKGNNKDEGQDVLKELEDLAAQRPTSRPATPGTKRTSAATPPADRSSEDKSTSRRSGDSTRPFHMSMTPAGTTPSEGVSAAESPQPQPEQQSSGGWWGGIFATASAAMKQAEAAVKEIQKNEEAQRWAEQVRGNVGALKGLGGELRTLAMPTFTSLVHTLAPPISSHERLQIHVTHDLSGYPSVDALIYDVFSRVMSQVEGGDLLVVQQGKESAPKRGDTASATAGWHDGPWWRYVSPGKSRSISAVKGAVVASKLARASAEAYATEYYSSQGGIEEAAKQASEILSESNPVRNSDIFLAIQALSQPVSTELFQAGPSAESDKPEGVMEVQAEPDEEVAFALYLHDPIHGITFYTISQAIPQKWIDWLDAPAADADSTDTVQSTVPEAIAEIIESGAIDPREWIAEWVEDTLTLGLGVIAQRYVARRMGVGEGGVGKGKMKAEMASTVESGAGEIARAL